MMQAIRESGVRVLCGNESVSFDPQSLSGEYCSVMVDVKTRRLHVNIPPMRPYRTEPDFQGYVLLIPWAHVLDVDNASFEEFFDMVSERTDVLLDEENLRFIEKYCALMQAVIGSAGTDCMADEQVYYLARGMVAVCMRSYQNYTCTICRN